MIKSYPDMCTAKKILALAAPLIMAAGTSHGQLTFGDLGFKFQGVSFGAYRQAPAGTVFEGGTFGFNIKDGSFAIQTTGLGVPCAGGGYFPPDPPCPIGATGYAFGSSPFLATIGTGPYFGVLQVTSATLLGVNRPESALLVSAPPSLLPRPNLGFTDQSIQMFYNINDVTINQYDVSGYELNREYLAGERTRFDGEAVPGTYKFNFPAIANPVNPLVLSINLSPKLDGYRKINNQPRGVRFLNLRYDSAGFALLDPFVINTIKWEGNGSTLIIPARDFAYFSIKRLQDPSNPLSAPNLIAPTVFPGFSGGGTSRVVLPNPLNTSYNIPPFAVTPGVVGLIDLEFEINRPTNNVISEQATRSFRLPVKVINPFSSMIAATLPPGATAQQLSADHDFDRDGISNFNEWVFGSNPASASSLPPVLGIQKVSPAPANKFATMAATAENSSTETFEFRVPKLTETDPKLIYSIEFSKDMITWKEIQVGDPAWNLVNAHSEIKVTSTGANTAPGGFFRAKVVSGGPVF
jgi:hypothetical protein